MDKQYLLTNLDNIISLYAEDKRVQQLGTLLSSDEITFTQISGSRGVQRAIIQAALYQQFPQYHFVIAADKEEAAYLHNDLDNLLGKKPVHFFPDSFKNPTNFERLHSGNTLQRTELVNRLSQSRARAEIFVTYPEALFEKVVSPTELSKNRIEINKDESLDVDTAIDILIEYGFERTDFVYEPGQFSIRGGIIDIFSYGNDWPYRIELFDDEVESIRLFDPLTQLSKREVAQVSIVPDVNRRFQRDQKVSLLQVLPSDTVIWVTNKEDLLERLQISFEKAIQFVEDVLPSVQNADLQTFYKEHAFIRPAEIMADLQQFSTVFVNDRKMVNDPAAFFTFDAIPQPNFNKNFKLLIENLKENEKAGITNYIFTDNAKQIERFHHIFEDLEANVQFEPVMQQVHQGFVDRDKKIACYTDHQIFQRHHKYRLKRGFTKDKSLTLRMLRDLRPGDYVVHIDHGVGKYSGLEKININGHIQESVRLIYQNNDLLYVSINSLHKIAKHSSKDGNAPKVSKLGSDVWKRMKARTKKKIKDMAGELIKLYAKRKASEGFAFPPDGYLQNELEASFIYEDTPDQLSTTHEVKADMSKAYPMDRLICGDVGFGKTEIAVRAAFKAIVGGKQVAILVPTTILALQHYKTFKDRLDEFGATIDYINRFRTTKEKRIIFEKLKSGEIDLVIGTHGLLNKDIGFKDLGLLIIDEEQKFGVAAKEKLRKLKVNVDTLTLTATPIPRTLQFSLMAARDLSVIRTPPPNRLAVHTETRIFNEELIRDAIQFEVNRGGQVFFVHNRVKSLPDVTVLLRRLCPDVDIAMAHGKMDPKELERTLLDFIERQYDVLVCTNIIETGLDIPNANTIIINNAHQFGMSDLHQLRGRVGRSNRQAYCYLLSPPLSTLTPDARKRLKAIEEFSDLGSGFNIAMRDLDIRGAGNLLGGEQSGFISDIGYETYQKILEEAIIELKEGDFRELFKEEMEQQRVFVHEVQIETDAEMLIPDSYVSNVQERLKLYRELDELETEEDMQAYREKLRDRFGPVPPQVDLLFEGLRIRRACKALGFDRLIYKKQSLKCFFVQNPQSPFYETRVFKNLLSYVSKYGNKQGLSFKQNNQYFMMQKPKVTSLEAVRKLLEDLNETVSKELVVQ